MTSKNKVINPTKFIKPEAPTGILICGESTEERDKYMKKVMKQCKDKNIPFYEDDGRDHIGDLIKNNKDNKMSVIFFPIGEHTKMDGATCQRLTEYLLFGASLRTAVVVAIENQEKLEEYVSDSISLIAEVVNV